MVRELFCERVNDRVDASDEVQLNDSLPRRPFLDPRPGSVRHLHVYPPAEMETHRKNKEEEEEEEEEKTHEI